MPSLQVRLFGQFSLCCGDEVLDELIPGKAKELFCYLLTHRGRPIAREVLASVLWGDYTTERSKQYLRKALWQLQSSLDNSSKLNGPILQVDSKGVSVRSDAELWVDLFQFELACSGEDSASVNTGASLMSTVETAVNLYRGDFLEGWYQDWCLYERERLQNIYLALLDKIVGYSESSGEYEKGLDYAKRILQCDRANESAHRHLMRLRYLSGDRSGALHQYEICAGALKEELDVQPSERTRKLYEHIREEHEPAIASGSQSVLSKAQEGPSLLQEVLNHLTQVKEALAVLQRAVDESVLRIEQARRSSGGDLFSSGKQNP
jgi:DNA-binding SARP family transcriptional activator